MRKLVLAFLILLGAIAAANAQGCGVGNPNCIAPTPAIGDNSNRIATTAFVQSATGGGALSLPANQIFIGNGGGPSVATPAPVTGDCTATYSSTNAVWRCIGTATTNQLLFNSAGVIAGITSIASAVAVTSAGSVPSFATTLPSGITIPGPTLSGTVAGSVTISGNNTYSGTSLFTGAVPSLTNGNAAVAASATGGGIFTGQGSVSDVSIQNKAGANVCTVGTGSTTINCATLTLTNPLAIAQGGTGQITQQLALNALAPTPTRTGDVIYWNGTNWINFAGNNSGTQCFAENSAGAPAWTACSGGGGAVAGTNTQVQFNNLGAFGASSAFTWISPALTIGLAVLSTGQLILTNATGGAVTIQVPSSVTPYNFNLPTVAGTAGQPLLSGGGGSNPQVYNTLGVAAGGTGLTAGTSGGFPYFSTTTTMASSALLTAFGPIYGGGVERPVAMAAGTNGQLIVGQTGAAPAWETMSGGCTLTALGVITCTVVNGVTYPVAPITSGGVLYANSTTSVLSSGLLALNGVLLGGGAAGAPTNVAAMTNGQIIVGQTSSAPLGQTMSGDATLAASGALTIAGNAVTNAKAAQMAVVTLKGNPTNALANATDFTLAGLVAQPSPSATLDLLLMWDHLSGTFKSVTPGVVAGSNTAGVSTLNSLSGALNIVAGADVLVTSASLTITISTMAAPHALLGGI